MDLNIYSHPACLGHELHIRRFEERKGRLLALTRLFNDLGLSVDEDIVPVTKAQLSQIHTPRYIDTVEAMSRLGPVRNRVASFTNPFVQWYTRVSPGSYDAARYAAGSVCKAVEDTMSGRCTRAFAAIRPPGHHAGPERGEGFCIFNNIAMGAVHALNQGARRVAIVDFDRHHGNGTQDIITNRDDSRMMLVSSYQAGCKYDKNHGLSGVLAPNIVTVPIAEGSTFGAVAAQYRQFVIPALRDFKPELILISAGFDMHEADPLSDIKLKSADYYHLTHMLVEAAEELCGGRIVSALEGGYDEAALAESVDYHLQALRGVAPKL
ncbi:MAG: deacetylase [Micavibrio sp.]|nr:deacetylase [Micavibrio sp.]